MSARIAQHLGAGQVFGVDDVPERLARARARGVSTIETTKKDEVVAAVRDATDGRGPDAVIDAVGMEAHGSDRKSTRLNSSHANISYAVFCLKKKQHILLAAV